MYRVERLLAHFRRFLAPDDEKIQKLEARLVSLGKVATGKDSHEASSFLASPRRA